MKELKLFGLNENATREDINRAYKNKIKIFHPDINKNPNASEIMKQLNIAKDILDKFWNGPIKKKENVEIKKKFSDVSELEKELYEYAKKEREKERLKKKEIYSERIKLDFVPDGFSKESFEKFKEVLKEMFS